MAGKVDSLAPLFSKTVLGVLFGLTFGKALEVSCGGIGRIEGFLQLWNTFAGNWFHYVCRLAQLLAFLATLFRFYAGSYCFHQQPPPSGLPRILTDLTGTVLLFIGFFVSALVVNTYATFLVFVASFHVLDACWFTVAARCATDEKIRVVAKRYVVYDAVTIVASVVILLAYAKVGFQREILQLITAGLLSSMFVIDMFQTHEFYFTATRPLSEPEEANV